MAAPAAAARSSHAPTRSRPKPQRRRSGAAPGPRHGSGRSAASRKHARPAGTRAGNLVRAAAMGVRGGAVTLPRPGTVTRPRTTTRPRPAPRPRTAARPRPRQGAAAPAFDRVLRSPGYIALVGVLLVGIVFFNVDVLQVNHGIAKTGARADTLKRENAVLTRELAKMASSERIQEAAAVQGLVLPPPGDVRYLKARGDDSRRALRTMTAPDQNAVITPPAPVPAAPAAPVTAVAAPVTTTPVTNTTPATTAPAAEQAPAAQTQPQTQTTQPPAAAQQPPSQTPAAATGGGTQATG